MLETALLDTLRVLMCFSFILDSGFVWDKAGHIVTNYHVVRNAKFAQVALITPRKGEKAPFGFLPSQQQQQQLPQQTSTSSTSDDGSSMDVFSVSPLARSTANRLSSSEYKRTVFKAKVIGVDPGKDIAVLKVDAPEELLYPIQVGKSAGLKVGQLSLAIGNPFGLDHSLTAGVISGVGREVKSPIGRPITNVIQVRTAGLTYRMTYRSYRSTHHFVLFRPMPLSILVIVVVYFWILVEN